MNGPLALHLPTFAIGDWIYQKALQTIPEADADRRLDPRTNGARSIALHLLVARHSLCALLGAPQPPLPWGDLGKGTQAGFVANAPRPTLAAILAAWQALAPHFHGAMRAASAQVLAAPSPMPIPGKPNATVADFAPLNAVHESYHLGQLGLLAKACTGTGILSFAG